MANKKRKNSKKKVVVPALPPQFKKMDYLRRKPIVTESVDHGVGKLTDHSGNHDVTIAWHLNDMAQKDKVFKLQIDDKVVYIDLEELTFYTRVMFVK